MIRSTRDALGFAWSPEEFGGLGLFAQRAVQSEPLLATPALAADKYEGGRGPSPPPILGATDRERVGYFLVRLYLL